MGNEYRQKNVCQETKTFLAFLQLHFFHPALAWMAVDLFSVASNKFSQQKEGANVK